jgi:hypothetical protein
MRRQLGDAYVEELRRTYGNRISGQSDLCCYWFEKAREQISNGKCTRAGLLATQGIRGSANREVLERIKDSGDIFFAESDREWILDGAMVHVSMVGYDGGTESLRILDGHQVSTINTNLTSAIDLTKTIQLHANMGIGFQGIVKVGEFEISPEVALAALNAPNPNGRPSSDVLFRWVNGHDITTRDRGFWIINFQEQSCDNAACYEILFKHLEKAVKPQRLQNRDRQRKTNWWRLGRSGADWATASFGLPRTIFTPRVSKHRLFVWVQGIVIPDSAVVGFARSDDYFFGVLHSRYHQIWALAKGTQLREKESGFRYTPTTCFETFPLPHPTPIQEAAIADAAKELNDLRERWLNPPEWTKECILKYPGSANGPWARYVKNPDRNGIGTVCYPRKEPRDINCAAKLNLRTLTNLYNERPAWLDLAHRKLDAAVATAYGWPADETDEQLLERLLALNLERASKEQASQRKKKTVLQRDKGKDEML